VSNLKKVVGVRLTDDLFTLVKTVSRARGEDVSDFLRRSILKELASLDLLPNPQRKALGLHISVNGGSQSKLDQ
jgi:hypothetical protein